MDLGADQERGLRREAQLFHDVRHGDEALVDTEVRVLGILDKPLVGEGVRPEYELEPVPFQNETLGNLTDSAAPMLNNTMGVLPPYTLKDKIAFDRMEASGQCPWMLWQK